MKNLISNEYDPITPSRPADSKRAALAIRDFLDALGFDPNHPELADTPERVAKAWSETLTEGHRADPRSALGGLHPSRHDGSVCVRGIAFVAVCPHHLMPFLGKASVAFIPDQKVPGFGRIAKLVDLCAHRLVLQEDLTASIADALFEAVRPLACAVSIEASHSCVAVSDPARMTVPFATRALRGDPARAQALSDQL